MTPHPIAIGDYKERKREPASDIVSITFSNIVSDLNMTAPSIQARYAPVHANLQTIIYKRQRQILAVI